MAPIDSIPLYQREELSNMDRGIALRRATRLDFGGQEERFKNDDELDLELDRNEFDCLDKDGDDDNEEEEDE